VSKLAPPYPFAGGEAWSTGFDNAVVRRDGTLKRVRYNTTTNPLPFWQIISLERALCA